MNHHRRYETLCALAAAGQLTDKEFREFESHREQCEACQAQMLAMMELSIRLSIRAGRRPGPAVPRGMRERFSARAIRQGVPLCSQEPSRGRSRLLRAGLVATVIVIAILSLHGRRAALVERTRAGQGFETARAMVVGAVPSRGNPVARIGEEATRRREERQRNSSVHLRFAVEQMRSPRERDSRAAHQSASKFRFMLPLALLSGNRLEEASIAAFRGERGFSIVLRDSPECSAWTVKGEQISAPWERSCTKEDKKTFHYDASVLDLRPFADSKAIIKTAAFALRFSPPSNESFQ